MAYSIVQTLYIMAFAFLFERMGFRFKWFLPLACVFVVASLLTVPEIGQGILPELMISGAEDHSQILATLMSLVFYPLHAFITVHFMKFHPQNTSRCEQWVIKGAIYMGAAMMAGFLLAVFMMIGMSIYLFTFSSAHL